MTKNEWKGHGAMWGAEVMWGLMAPVSKLVLASAVTPLLLTDCRMLGAACLFWLASVFTKPEHVASKDLLLLFCLSVRNCIQPRIFYIWIKSDITDQCIYYNHQFPYPYHDHRSFLFAGAGYR